MSKNDKNIKQCESFRQRKQNFQLYKKVIINIDNYFKKILISNLFDDLTFLIGDLSQLIEFNKFSFIYFILQEKEFKQQKNTSKGSNLSYFNKLINIFYIYLKQDDKNTSFLNYMITIAKYFQCYFNNFAQFPVFQRVNWKMSTIQPLRKEQEQLNDLILVIKKWLKQSKSDIKWQDIVNQQKKTQKSDEKVQISLYVWKFIRSFSHDFINQKIIAPSNSQLQKISQIIPTTIFQEIALNRLKQNLINYFQSHSFKIKKCCSIFFRKGQIFDSQQQQFNQYENIAFPMQQIDQKIILKSFCSFLNSEGGIHYIGFRKQNDNKIITVGKALSQSQIKQFVMKINRLFENIHPMMKKQSLKVPQILERKELLRLRVNKWIQLQLIPIMQQGGQYDAVEQNQKQGGLKRVYAIKIKVRGSKTMDTYQVRDVGKDNQRVLQSYIRENDGLRRLSVSEWVDLVGKRAELYFQERIFKNPYCQNCRFDYNVEE